MVSDEVDVLVVGGGPSGAATALRLAALEYRVTLLEKRRTDRHKACGDLLSQRATHELTQLGLLPGSAGAHELTGFRLRHGDHGVALDWPTRSDLPSSAFALRRSVLDPELRRLAAEAGATVEMGHEATVPLIDRGFVRGASVDVVDEAGERVGQRDLAARFVVVADGANSAFGRALGTTRHRRWPYGIAARTYFESPRHADRHCDAHLALRTADGDRVAGYGWVIPLGDGTLNVGVGISSAGRDVIGVNVLRLLDTFTRSIADEWELDPDAQLKEPTRLRLPLGGSVGPTMGPTFLVVGDAGGLANPLNGDGVEAALVSARHAAAALDAALAGRSSTALQQYATDLRDDVAEYHHVARLSTRLLGRPGVLGPVVTAATRSAPVAGALARVATRTLRPHSGGAERLYRVATAAARLAPSW